MAENIEEILLKLPDYFVAERATGVSVTAQLNLLSETPDAWTLDIHERRCQIRHERTDDAQMELTVQTADLLDILGGRLSASKAYMQGKLSLHGNLLQAMKIMELFEIPDEIMGKISL